MKKILFFAALAGAVLWTGCQEKEEDIVKEEPVKEAPQLFTLTVQAVKDVDTKALELVEDEYGSHLKAYWVDGEKVAVYKYDNVSNTYSNLGKLTVDADESDPQYATLSGTLDSVEGVTVGTELSLLFPRAERDYTGQDGTAPSEKGSLAKNYDYAEAKVSVTSMENGVITTGDAEFRNLQRIYRFGFKVGGSGGTAIRVKEFTVDSDSEQLVRKYDYSSNKITYGSLTVKVSGDATTDLLYMAIGNGSAYSGGSQTYSFHVIADGNALYTGSQSIGFEVLQDVNINFISAQNVNVGQATLATATTTTTEVW